MVAPSDFAASFLRELSRGYQETDTATLRAMSDPGCGGCNNLLRAIEDARAAGERTIGGQFRLLTAAAPAVDAGETIVEMRYSRDPAVVVNMSGEQVAQIPADPPLNAQMRLRLQGTTWRVLGLQAAQQ